MKPVGQCLTTAVMASALFDLYMLHPVDASTVESGEASPTANQAESTDPAPAPVEAIAPPEIISPVAAQTAPVEAAPVAPTQAVVEQPAPPPAETEVPVAPTPENAAPPVAESAAPVGASTASDTTPAPSVSPVTEEARIEAVRQKLADEMQAMLERDRPQREAQLKQNLVAAAYHYAQAGQVEQARQMAQHPVFSAEEQAELLVQIDKLLIAGQKQPPVIEGIVATAQPPAVGSPGSGVMLPSAWSTGRLSVVRPNWTAACPVTPTTPVRTVAAVPSPTATTQSSVPQAAVQPLPTSVVALDVASIAKQTNPSASEQVTVQNTVALPKVAEWQLDPALKAVNKPSKLDQVAVDLELGQMVGSALTGMLDKVGVKPAVVLPSSVTSALGLWFEPTIYHAEDWVANGQTQTNPSASLTLSEDAQLAAAELTQTPLFQDVENSLFAGLSKSSQIAGTAASKLKAEQSQAVMVSVTQSALATMNCGSIPAANFSLGDAVRSVLPQQLRNVGMVFPLPIPAALTSAFGWRVHPISGDRRFHAGIDLGAPTGTPVLAAVSGRVVAADYMGGYGLAIVIENGSAPQRNLYAHLSGIAVRPGMQIEQGSVIGWVGSTGNSTGPHLHFETQALTTSGWTAVNPLAASFATASASQ